MTPEPQPIRRVVLATDLGDDAPARFAQALGLTLRLRCELFLLHVADELHPEASFRNLPTVRALLEQWGRLHKDEPYAAFEALGIHVHPLERTATDGDVPAAVTRHLTQLNPDLLLVGTHHRSGLAHLARASVAEGVSRDTRCNTLFLHHGTHPLVHPDTGNVELRRVLVPIAGGKDLSVPALLQDLVRVVAALTDGPVQFVLLHVGDFGTLPEVRLPEESRWSWKTELRAGAVVNQILEAETEYDVDLVAMGTHGHDSLLDELLGSVTERVVRKSRCPVLALPV